MDNSTYTYEETKSIKTGVFLSVLMILFIVYFMIYKSAVKQKSDIDSYNLTAKFGQSDGLKVGDDVMLSGIRIGKVIKTELSTNFQTIVTMNINDVNIPEDSSASIVSSGLISSKFVSIEPGGDETNLKNNEEFHYTQNSMILTDLIERVIGMSKNNKDKGENHE